MGFKLSHCSVFAGAFFWLGSALAEPSAADRATARSLAGEGYQALQAKDFAAAADRFSRADALVHAPTLMIDWARALVGIGKLVEAQERYEQIIREGVDAKSPKSWQRALNDAGNELAQIKPRLSWITIIVSGSSEARVSVDGVAVPPAAVGVRRAVNPGERTVRVTAKGFLPQKQAIALAEGGESKVDFTLEPDPDAQLVKAAPEAPRPAPVQPEAHGSALTYVAFGLGGAGLVLGGVTGALALSKRSELSDACDSASRCRSDQDSSLHSYHSLGTVSGVGFAVGIAGIGAGVTLWLLHRNPSPAPAQGVVLRPFVGLGSVGASGSF